MSDFGTVTEELRRNRLEQKKVTTLTEKLLAEKKLDDSASQILKAAIPEVAAEVLGSNKITKANEATKESNAKVISAIGSLSEIDKYSDQDELLATIASIENQMFIVSSRFYSEFFNLVEAVVRTLNVSFDKDNLKRVRDGFVKGTEEIQAELKKQMEVVNKTLLKSNEILEEIDDNTEENKDKEKKETTSPLIKFLDNDFSQRIFSVVGGLFSKTIGFIGGLASSAKDFLFGITGKVFGLLGDTLNFFLKPFKVLFSQAGNIFGGVLTIVLLGALVDFLRSPLWKDNKDGIAGKIGEGIQFVVDKFNGAVESMKNAMIQFERFLFSFLDSRIVRFIVGKDFYSDEFNRTIDLVKAGGVKDQIKATEEELAFIKEKGGGTVSDIMLGKDPRFGTKFESFGALRNINQLEKDLDDLKAELPEQRQITRNIEKLISERGMTLGAPPVVMTNSVANDVRNFTTTQKFMLPYGSKLLDALLSHPY